jgi:hypothetical protein
VLSSRFHLVALSSLPRFSTIHSTLTAQPVYGHSKIMNDLVSNLNDLSIDESIIQNGFAMSKDETELCARLAAVRFGFPIRLKDSPRFMSLPREFRNAIYHELCKLAPVRALSFDGHPAKLHYEAIDAEHPRCVKGLPNWLLINWAFLSEGMAQFHLKATWAFEPKTVIRYHTSHWVRIFPTNPPETMPDSRAARETTELLDLSTARDVTFRTNMPVLLPLHLFTIPRDD